MKGARKNVRAAIALSIALLLLASAMLAACGPAAEPTEAPMAEEPAEEAVVEEPVEEPAAEEPMSTELNIWTWGIYCPDFAVDSFKEKYGITVNCTFYHGNEELWSKVQAGHEGLDIIQPSHFMIPRFAEADLLSPIDISQIPNYEGVYEGFRDADYMMWEGEQYSAPYTFGINGICYRTDFVDEEVTSWQSLWNEEYAGHVGWSRNPDDAVQAVALYLGIEPASLDEDTDAKLEQIAEAMREQNPLLLARFESLAEEKNLLAEGDLWITSSDDGLCRQMILDGQPVALVVPAEGATAWIDQFAIMADAPHKDAAHLWIDHMLSPEMASQMIEEIGYLVVNQAAQESLSPELKEVMTYSEEEAARLVPMPSWDPETVQKVVATYQDVRGE
jgi:spermidine/putrescine transport system substrate-binding protein